MTRKEFCELMAAGHEEAARNLGVAAEKAHESKAIDAWLRLSALLDQELAISRAFRNLAKEQDQ